MDNKNKNNRGRFGTFAGVFTPNVLTILGIILFLRTGWLVGQAGLFGALIIIGMANVISLLTGLSLSSVATNMPVRTGGSYFMISRTLGLEIGGAIGIPLFFSQAISVAFYIIGFSEAFTTVFPQVPATSLSLSLILLFGLFAFLGADFVLRIQFFILAILCSAIISVFAGGWDRWVTPHLFATSASTADFWEAFAVFFPAVTGIMVGVSMSGDLKNPEKSIPRGTLTSIGVTALIYLVTATWLGLHATQSELMSDNLVMQKVARWSVFVLIGVWASTLSSALGSILAAPRTLQALSFDRVTPRMMGYQLGSSTEPRVAVLITTAIATVIVLMGDLDFVAPIISMFFLNTYGMINLTAGIENMVANPSFRPHFKVPWVVSLLGGLACYTTMFLINGLATVIAIFISYGVYLLLKRRTLRQNWGDMRSGLWFTLSRYGLTHFEKLPVHARNWRPNIVAFTGAAVASKSREQLMQVGIWLSSGRGIVTLYHLLMGKLEKLADRGLQDTSCESLRRYVNENSVTAFVGCSIVNDFYDGVLTVVQAHGVSGLEPNTALLGWSNKSEIQKEQMILMRQLIALKKSALFLHYNEERDFGIRRQIDVWWRGRDRNAELMLMLAHIISKSSDWEGARIRVLRLLRHEEGRDGVEQHIEDLAKSARVEAQPIVLIEKEKDDPFFSAFRENSRNSDLVFLGLPVPRDEEIQVRAGYLHKLLQSSPSALLVRSAEVEDILEPQ
jgi:amino acid transporter